MPREPYTYTQENTLPIQHLYDRWTQVREGLKDENGSRLIIERLKNPDYAEISALFSVLPPAVTEIRVGPLLFIDPSAEKVEHPTVWGPDDVVQFLRNIRKYQLMLPKRR